ncbi:MAG: hypothetical protein ACRDZ2_08210, partial [Ilumatobacteraceae bacterium]
MILAGPVVGMTYFWVVYLLAEASCSGDLALLGTATLRTTILAATAGVIAVFAAYAWRARRLWAAPGSQDVGAGDIGHGDGADDRRQNRRFMLVTGSMLLGMFALFALFMA